MSGKNMIILAIAAILVGALALRKSRDKDSFENTETGRKILAEVNINKIDRIEIEENGIITSISKTDTGWVIPSKFNYPADFRKVRNLLLKLETATFGQVLSVNETQKKSMKVTPSLATGLRLMIGEDIKTELLLGETRKRKVTTTQLTAYGGVDDGRFLSADGGNTIYLTFETLREVVVEPKNWLNEQILSVPESDITSIDISCPNADAVKLSLADDGKLTLPDLADDEEFDTSKSYSVKGALSYLRFKDIADPTLSDEDLGFDDPGIYKAVSTNGQVYTIQIGASPANSNDRYIRISAAYNPPAIDETKDTDEETNDKTASENEAASRQELLAEDTKDLNEKLVKWTFIVAEHTADGMQKTRDELVKKVEKQKEDETPANEDKEIQ